MAKLFRVFGYLVSPNSDDLRGTKKEVNDALLAIKPAFPSWWKGLHVDEVDLGKLDDNHPLSNPNCLDSSCARYFEETDKYLGMAQEIRKVYEAYRECNFDYEQAMRLTVAYVKIAFEKQANGMYYRVRPKSEIMAKHRERLRQAILEAEKDKEDVDDLS